MKSSYIFQNKKKEGMTRVVFYFLQISDMSGCIEDNWVLQSSIFSLFNLTRYVVASGKQHWKLVNQNEKDRQCLSVMTIVLTLLLPYKCFSDPRGYLGLT